MDFLPLPPPESSPPIYLGEHGRQSHRVLRLNHKAHRASTAVCLPEELRAHTTLHYPLTIAGEHGRR